MQIKGFAHCIEEFSRISFGIQLEGVFNRLQEEFQQFNIQDLPKVFKGTLAHTFSKYADQEFPDVPLELDILSTFPRLLKAFQTVKRISQSHNSTSTKSCRHIQKLWNLLNVNP